MRKDFCPDTEIAYIKRYDKKLKKNVIKEFPLVGGRLRLYHEDISEKNYNCSGIACEIVKYDDDIAVVKASVTVNGSIFTGTGMSSKSRDATIYPAIIELAETRAIARALRFAGYGVEYTGAEEMGSVKSFVENSTDKRPSEKSEKKDVTVDDEDVEPEPKEEKPPKNESEVSLKRQAWDFAKSAFGDYDESILADAMRDFVNRTMESQDQSVTADFVFKAILAHKAQFTRSFGKMLQPLPEDEPADTPPEEEQISQEEKKEIKNSMKDLAKKASVKKEEPGESEVRRLKAKIYMAMPDGTIVGSLNEALDQLVSDNQDRKVEEIYSIVLQDMDSFIDIFIEHCSVNKIETGLPGEAESKKPDEVVATDPDKKTYSSFRKQWANLGWDSFKVFVIQNANKFREDEVEYNAAVLKYDKLKEKNDEKELCFPYLFKYEDKKPEVVVLDDSKSVLKEDKANVQDSSTMKQYRASFPEMCKRVTAASGISVHTTDHVETETFLDEFEHQIITWEAKNKKTYKE